MSIAGYTDIPLEVFSGLVTDVSPADLPAGVSPDCQDVAFELAGAVRTRPGLATKLLGLSNNVNYLKTYVPQPGTIKNLILDSSGALSQETADGGSSVISASACTTNSFAKSTTLFASATSQSAKEWMAFHDGKFGIDIPRQFDNTNFDRVSQVGPGAAITATESPVAGNIPAGVHKVSVIFVTRQGYWTQPSPPTSWTASGGRKVTLTNVWTGPANVVARIVCFTAAGQSSFFFTNGQNGLPQMQVFDNSTTQPADFDFTDAQLTSGTNVDYLFRLVELGACAGVVDYNGRLIWWGERNKVNNFMNLSFDGGFNGGLPLGWSLGAAGGSEETVNVVWGSAFKILGDGVTATRGYIFQSAYQDYNGVPIVRPNVQYSVRARLRLSGTPTQGGVAINLFSNSGGISTPGFFVNFSGATSSYREFSAVLGGPFSSIPTDLVLQIFGNGTITNGAGFIVDNLEVFPTNQPYNDSTLRLSRVFDPESYDGINGMISIAPNSGQRITSCFKIKERLFIVKERSLYVTQDTGNSEPSFWTVTEVSNKVGTSSVNGVSVGEDWAILADRSGAYITEGSEPRKLSQEIQPTWDTINNNALHTIWTTVDTRTRRMYFGVPTGTALTPNKIFVLDYRGMNSAEEIADGHAVQLFIYTGTLRALSKARRWVPWSITSNSGAVLERFDGTAQVAIGNGTSNGKMYLLSDTQFSDDGAAINSYYVTYLFPTHEQEAQYQITRHRKLAGYMTIYVEGTGTFNVSAYPASLSAGALTVSPFTLSNPGLRDLERPINILGERVAFRLGTNSPGAWFKLQRFVPAFAPDPAGVVRGA
jgi:hypothetical protein